MDKPLMTERANYHYLEQTHFWVATLYAGQIRLTSSSWETSVAQVLLSTLLSPGQKFSERAHQGEKPQFNVCRTICHPPPNGLVVPLLSQLLMLAAFQPASGATQGQGHV